MRRAATRSALQSGATSYTLSLVIPPSEQAPSFSLAIVAQYGTGTAAANLSAPASSNLNVVTSASSSATLQATLSWYDPVDLDLHVTPPGGTEIGYNNRSSEGGTLDVDSNAGCNIDNIDRENVTWASTTAPVGVYRIRPDYWSNCNIMDDVDYVLTVRTSDTIASPSGQPQQYFDTFSASEADENASPLTDTSHVVYGALLPNISTDPGIISHLILAEIGAPSSSSYTLSAATLAGQAVRAIVENRRYCPRCFSANSSSTHDIVFAKNVQFAGFNPNGTIDPSLLTRFVSSLIPTANLQPDTTSSAWVPFWNSIITASTAPYVKATGDPFAAVTASLTAPYITNQSGAILPSVPVFGGSYGVRTTGHPYSSAATDITTFRLVGSDDGQDFYSLNKAYTPAPPP